MKGLGSELRQRRENSGISQGDLAKRIKVSRFTINKYESGESAPSVDRLAKLCEILGTTSFVVYGQRIEIGLDGSTRKPCGVPKQLRLRLGIICATDHGTILAPLAKTRKRLDIEVLSA